MARQAHGKEFEKAVMRADVGFVMSAKSGDRYDGKIWDLSVSVKSHVEGSQLCLGDFNRHLEEPNDFCLIVGTTKKGVSPKEYISVEAYFIDGVMWREWFEYDAAYCFEPSYIRRFIGNGREYDEIWKNYREFHRANFIDQHFDFQLVMPAPKRDHKNQMRIQAEIPAAQAKLISNYFEKAFSDEFTSRIMNSANGMPLDTAVIEPDTVAKRAALLEQQLDVAGRSLDKYFTGPHNAARCVARLEEYCGSGGRKPLKDYSCIVEPSAGAGAFLRPLRNAAQAARILAYDIDPVPADDLGLEIRRLDFMTERDKIAADIKGEPAVVVGNPPFGTNCSLAVAFINGCFELPSVDLVAFILPLSFMKDSIKSRIKNCHVEFEVRLTGEDCMFENFQPGKNGRHHPVPSCFQIWARGAAAAPLPAKEPTGWKYIKISKRDENPEEGGPPLKYYHVQVIRAGGGAGMAYLRDGRRAACANYFLVVDDCFLDRVDDLVRDICARRAELEADFGATTGPRSLAKDPLTRLVNDICAGYAAEAPRAAEISADMSALNITDDDIEEIVASLTE
jgi:hypothetical protein